MGLTIARSNPRILRPQHRLQLYPYAPGLDTVCLYGGQLTAKVLTGDRRLVRFKAKKVHLKPGMGRKRVVVWRTILSDWTQLPRIGHWYRLRQRKCIWNRDWVGIYLRVNGIPRCGSRYQSWGANALIIGWYHNHKNLCRWHASLVRGECSWSVQASLWCRWWQLTY